MAYPIEGYQLENQQYIKEIDGNAFIYHHKKSGAKVLLIPNDDPHKSFCIGFRTPPPDSTGIAHILEHSVLCGSEKYPLKDPFVELAKGSLNTYLNAMTYPDKTLYPISSQNDKDFQNLMDVYLDAVFHPNIYKSKEIMMQEGWRYHLENKEDPIEYRGVVYNEMKGAFSSSEEIGFRFIKETLFPDTIYRNESGGTPSVIPDLSYEEFIAFHKAYYHPSNSYICLYGDMDPVATLTYISEKYLSQFDYCEIDSQIDLQKPFKEEIEKTSFYSAVPNKENGLFLSYNFVVGETVNRELILAMSILEYILLDTPASPLKKALIAEGIGEDVYGALQTHLRQPIFSIVAKNVKPEKKERFYELIREVLTGLVKNGLPKHLLNGAMQVKEFELREGDATGYSKGLFYGIAAIKAWIYDACPCTFLKYDEALEAVKQNMHSGYFEAIIEKYLLNNTHASRVILEPKNGLEKEQEEAVIKKLADYKASLSDKQIDELIAETKRFNAFQAQTDSEEAVKCIPLLKKSDLTREIKFPRFKVTEKDEVTYVVTPVFTNQIAYINWYINLEGIEERYMPYLGLIVGMLGKLDTEAHDYETLSSIIDEHIGSMSYGISAHNDFENANRYIPTFTTSSKALAPNLKEQVALMYEILTSTKFDNDTRLLEILREVKAILEANMSSDGHRVAYNRLLAHLSGTQQFEEQTKGLSFYHFVCDLEKDWANQKQEIIKCLKEAYAYLANKKRLMVGITIDEELVEEAINKVSEGISYLPSEALCKAHQNDFKITGVKEALIYPSNVNYAATGYNFKAAGFEYHGGLLMLKTLLSMDYLWTKVRVQNGAYGCFCDFRRSGNMFFVSYRDPNIDQTLEIYKKVADYVSQINLSERELVQYLIGTISSLDFPYTPASEGKTAQVYYLMGVKKEAQQRTRDELFETDNDVLRSFAPLLKACLEQDLYCVFGNEQNIANANTPFDTKTIV